MGKKDWMIPVGIIMGTVSGCGSGEFEQVQSSLSAVGGYHYPDEHRLPWTGGKKYMITQAPGSQYSHNGMMAHAWDFGMPTGTPILAPVDGCVRRLNNNATVSYGSQAQANNVNYVVLTWDSSVSGAIYPGRAIESLFLHLSEVDSLIKIGDCVSRGTVLGESGCTGWCNGPHLHYQVQEPTSYSWYQNSLPVQFAEKIPFVFGSYVESQNLTGPIITPEPKPESDQDPKPEPTPTPQNRFVCTGNKNPVQQQINRGHWVKMRGDAEAFNGQHLGLAEMQIYNIIDVDTFEAYWPWMHNKQPSQPKVDFYYRFDHSCIDRLL